MTYRTGYSKQSLADYAAELRILRRDYQRIAARIAELEAILR